MPQPGPEPFRKSDLIEKMTPEYGRRKAEYIVNELGAEFSLDIKVRDLDSRRIDFKIPRNWPNVLWCVPEEIEGPTHQQQVQLTIPNLSWAFSFTIAPGEGSAAFGLAFGKCTVQPSMNIDEIDSTLNSLRRKLPVDLLEQLAADAGYFPHPDALKNLEYLNGEAFLVRPSQIKRS